MYSSLHPSLSLCSFSPSCKPLIYLSRSDPSKFDRRRGFSTRVTAAMFIATVINFLLFSLRTGTEVAGFIVFIRKGLMIILDIDYPLSEKRELVNNALRNVNLVGSWSETLPVSIKLLILDSVSIHTVWRYFSVISLSFGGPGPSSQINSA